MEPVHGLGHFNMSNEQLMSFGDRDNEYLEPWFIAAKLQYLEYVEPCKSNNELIHMLLYEIAFRDLAIGRMQSSRYL